jgi:hypothetical protein
MAIETSISALALVDTDMRSGLEAVKCRYPASPNAVCSARGSSRWFLVRIILQSTRSMAMSCVRLRVRLREQRSKTRTLARQKQREIRGKAEQRAKSFPFSAEQPLRRKQVFANALKRVNKEINRLRKFEARTAHVEAASRAFALSRSEKFIEYPAARKTAREGMQSQVIMRRRTAVPRSKIRQRHKGNQGCPGETRLRD